MADDFTFHDSAHEEGHTVNDVYMEPKECTESWASFSSAGDEELILDLAMEINVKFPIAACLGLYAPLGCDDIDDNAEVRDRLLSTSFLVLKVLGLGYSKDLVCYPKERRRSSRKEAAEKTAGGTCTYQLTVPSHDNCRDANEALSIEVFLLHESNFHHGRLNVQEEWVYLGCASVDIPRPGQAMGRTSTETKITSVKVQEQVRKRLVVRGRTVADGKPFCVPQVKPCTIHVKQCLQYEVKSLLRGGTFF